MFLSTYKKISHQNFFHMCEIISFIRKTQARNKLDMAQYAEIKFLAEYIPGIPLRYCSLHFKQQGVQVTF